MQTIHHPSLLTLSLGSGIKKDPQTLFEGDYSNERVWCCQKKSTSVGKDFLAVFYLKVRDHTWWLRSKIWRCKYPSLIVLTPRYVYSILLHACSPQTSKVSGALIAIWYGSRVTWKPKKVWWDQSLWMEKIYPQTELHISITDGWIFLSLLLKMVSYSKTFISCSVFSTSNIPSPCFPFSELGFFFISCIFFFASLKRFFFLRVRLVTAILLKRKSFVSFI